MKGKVRQTAQRIIQKTWKLWIVTCGSGACSMHARLLSSRALQPRQRPTSGQGRRSGPLDCRNWAIEMTSFLTPSLRTPIFFFFFNSWRDGLRGFRNEIVRLRGYRISTLRHRGGYTVRRCFRVLYGRRQLKLLRRMGFIVFNYNGLLNIKTLLMPGTHAGCN